LCLRTTPDLFCRSHRFQNAFYDLFSARSMRGVGRFGFEKFSVCEYDAELIIQLVKQHAELWIRCETFHASAIRAAWRG